MNVFASQFLGSLFNLGQAGATPNGLGLFGDGTSFMSLLQTGDGLASAGLTSFADLSSVKGEAGTMTPEQLLLALKNAGQNDIKTEDLASADIIMSDLLGLSWQSLQNGETITLANGWTIGADATGALQFYNEDQTPVFPAFSKDQLQELLEAYKNLDGFRGNSMAAAELGAAISDEANTKNDAKALAAQANKKEMLNDLAAQILTAEAKKTTTDISFAVNTLTNGAAVAANSNSPANMGASNPLRYFWASVEQSQIQRDAYLNADMPFYSAGSARAAANAGSAALMFSAKGSAFAIANDVLKGSLSLSHDAADGITVLASAIDAAPTDMDALSLADSELNDLLQKNDIKQTRDGVLAGNQPVPPAQLSLIIQKMAERGDTRVLNVRLDPPELGRVQVSLSSGNDKIVKAHILVEKSEAASLLKRDLTSLEKALHDAGISLDEAGVTIDLASDGHGQNAFAQQAFMDMWADKNTDNKLARSGTEDASVEMNTAAIEPAETFYQNELAVNIKV